MNVDMNHAPFAGLIARPVDQQSSALPLCCGCPQKTQEAVYVDVVNNGENEPTEYKLSGIQGAEHWRHFW